MARNRKFVDEAKAKERREMRNKRLREKRAQMSHDEKEAFNLKASRNLDPTKAKVRRERKSQKRREQIALMTPDEKKAFNKKKQSNLDPTKAKKRRQQKNTKRREKRAMMTPEERKAFNKKDRGNENPTKLKIRLERKKAKEREKWAKMTPEEKEVRRPKKTGEKLERSKKLQSKVNRRTYARKKATIAAMPKEEQKKVAAKKREESAIYRRLHPTRVRESQIRSRANMTPAQKQDNYAKDRAWGSVLTCCLFCNKQLKRLSLRAHMKLHAAIAHLHQPPTEEDREELERRSRGGYDSKKVRAAHCGMVTGSWGHDVLVGMRKGTAGKLAQKIINYRTFNFFKGTRHMKDGTAYEAKAAMAYWEREGIPAKDRVKDVGICQARQTGCVGATPDGVFRTRDGKKGCLELKYVANGIKTAGYLLREGSRSWTSGKLGAYIGKVMDPDARSMQLSRNQKHFTQVTMEVMSSDADFCDFVVYSINKSSPDGFDMWRERILRNDVMSHWTASLPTWQQFVANHLVAAPCVLSPLAGSTTGTPLIDALLNSQR